MNFHRFFTVAQLLSTTNGARAIGAKETRDRESTTACNRAN